MNLQELESKLKEAKIRNSFYSLSGGLPSEAFCINSTGKGWEVYYSEHGEKTNLRTFNTESEACEYFYKYITSDRVVMSNLD